MSGFDFRRYSRAVLGWIAARDWGGAARLAYVIVVLAMTLPVIFYALASYQYQLDAAAIAEETGVDAKELMWRAAYFNNMMQEWAEGARPGPDATTPANGGTKVGGDTEDSEVADPGAWADCEQAWARQCAIPRPEEDSNADTVALALAAELQRFDRMSLPPSWPLYGRPSVLAELPHWTLTLVVTLVAGLLGSLIFVLKTTLRQRLDVWSAGTTVPQGPRPWSWFLLRPVFGVVVALGAYVALQSGLLVFDGAMSLEPSAYVTAAVGLIAGLLSWHVIDTIERIGQQWLDSHRPHWGYGLQTYIEVREAKVSELAEKVDVSQKLLEHWMAQRLPVPKEYTKRLAAELNVHPEVLFSSVPPWRRSKAATGA